MNNRPKWWMHARLSCALSLLVRYGNGIGIGIGIGISIRMASQREWRRAGKERGGGRAREAGGGQRANGTQRQRQLQRQPSGETRHGTAAARRGVFSGASNPHVCSAQTVPLYFRSFSRALLRALFEATYTVCIVVNLPNEGLSVSDIQYLKS